MARRLAAASLKFVGIKSFLVKLILYHVFISIPLTTAPVSKSPVIPFFFPSVSSRCAATFGSYPMCTAICSIKNSWPFLLVFNSSRTKYICPVSSLLVSHSPQLCARLGLSQISRVNAQMYHGELRGISQISILLMPHHQNFWLYLAALRHSSEYLTSDHIQLQVQANWCLRFSSTADASKLWIDSESSRYPIQAWISVQCIWLPVPVWPFSKHWSRF